MCRSLRALLIKTSSLGDLVHIMPALSDSVREVPGLEFDWVVEHGFADLCRWHSAVRNVIPVSMRRWRSDVRSLRLAAVAREMAASKRAIKAHRYDAVIDAQGLMKSAFLTRWALGPKFGFDRNSAREGLAALAYDTAFAIAQDIDIVERNRRLLAGVFGYDLPTGPPDFGLNDFDFPEPQVDTPYVLFIHGASWATKRWPLKRWRELAEEAATQGYRTALPWYSPAEREFAETIANDVPAACPVKVDLETIGGLIRWASGVASVETGLGHLAAAMGRPSVTIYGPSGIGRHRTRGPICSQLVSDLPCSPCHSRHRCALVDLSRAPAPCMEAQPARLVWDTASPVNGQRARFEPVRARFLGEPNGKVT